MLNILDLFSGIGGFSLGLEWTGGFQTVAFCENNLSCHKVLNKYWKNVPIYLDIKEMILERLRKDKIPKIDIITGGFPCQDISQAGKREGIKASRSGLWMEMCRLVGEIRPRYVIVENVQALLHRGIESVLADLAEVGYDTEWHCIPASAIGAPHQRDRVWIIAYPCGKRGGRREIPKADRRSRDTGGEKAKILSNTDSRRQRKREVEESGVYEKVKVYAGRAVNSHQIPISSKQPRRKKKEDKTGECLWQDWTSEPDVGRVAYGIPNRVDRLRQLGNSVVPQIPYLIGMAILEYEKIRKEKR